jgi:hypothetical protein
MPHICGISWSPVKGVHGYNILELLAEGIDCKENGVSEHQQLVHRLIVVVLR